MAGPNGSFKAGKRSRIVCSGTNLTAHTYDCAWDGDSLDTSNFECNGKRQGLIGFEDLTWSLNADWNADQNPADDPPGLYPREDGDQLTMYTAVGSDNFNMPVFRCFKTSISSKADGKVSYVSNGMSQGDFTTI